MIHLGIDLGTTYSLISHVNSHGQPALFPDYLDANEFRTPSVIHIGPDGCLVGQTVEEMLEDEPDLPAIRFVKLAMGSDEPPHVDDQGRDWSARALSALILKKLLIDAKAFANEDFGSGVITVPAQFNDMQRRATKNAALLAGLGSMTLVEEPVAAATYYGMNEGSADRTLLVYDLGGGTFDATVLQTSPDGLFVLATAGTNKIGGKDFDEAIIQAISKDFEAQHNIAPLADPAAYVRLRRLAEDTKIKLSKPGSGRFRKSLLLMGKPYEFLLTRSQFEALILGMIEETIDICDECLAEAALDWQSIDKILLTGGSSLIPLVLKQLGIRSGKPAADLIRRQPHQAVAYGAAILAERFAKESADQDGVIQQVAGTSLGLRVWDRRAGRPAVEELIQRNTTLPASYTRTFYTTRPDQIRLILEFVQSKSAEDVISLGYFEFGPINNPRKNYPIEVTATYHEEGTITATAKDSDTGQIIDRLFSEDSTESPELFAKEKALVDGSRVNE